MPMELVRLATTGSVDDGKSTLIGRMLQQCIEDLALHVAQSSIDLGIEFLAVLRQGAATLGLQARHQGQQERPLRELAQFGALGP
mgnify:CR=1 FL=1